MIKPDTEGIFKSQLPQLPQASGQSKFWWQVSVPILIAVAMIGWARLVSPYSRYGDNWAIYPVMMPFNVKENLIGKTIWVLEYKSQLLLLKDSFEWKCDLKQK
jgi:hypothetical protein